MTTKILLAIAFTLTLGVQAKAVEKAVVECDITSEDSPGSGNIKLKQTDPSVSYSEFEGELVIEEGKLVFDFAPAYRASAAIFTITRFHLGKQIGSASALTSGDQKSVGLTLHVREGKDRSDSITCWLRTK